MSDKTLCEEEGRKAGSSYLQVTFSLLFLFFFHLTRRIVSFNNDTNVLWFEDSKISIPPLFFGTVSLLIKKQKSVRENLINSERVSAFNFSH